MNSWYVVQFAPRNKMSKPAPYCVSDNGCFVDEVVVLACCLRACFRESRVAISGEARVRVSRTSDGGGG